MLIPGPTGKLYIDDGGQAGVPALFVPSAGGDTSHWSAVLAHLRGQGRRAVAMDLRGHGQSDAAPDHDFRMASLAGDIAAVADALGLQRFVLVGHSLGGSAAMAYAGLHPERLAGLMVVDGSGDPSPFPEPVKQQIFQALEGDGYAQATENYWGKLLARATSLVREKVLAGMRKLPRQAVINQLHVLFDYNPKHDLERYPGPKLAVVIPENDTPHAAHALVPEFPHVVVPGTGHWIHLDQPEMFEKILDDFLARVDGRDR